MKNIVETSNDLEKESMDSKQIKVLHMTMLGAGGISTLIVNINRCLDLTKVKFDYLVFRDRKEFYEDDVIALNAEKKIADVENIKNKFFSYYQKYKKTKSILENNHYDVMHVNASTPLDVVIAAAAKRSGVKCVVFHSHNAGIESRNLLKKFYNNICKTIMPFFITDYFSTSDIAAEFMFSKKIVRNHSYKIIKNGIYADNYYYSEEKRKKFRDKMGIQDEFVIGHIGRFSTQKNHVFIIQIFKELVAIENKAKLILVGDGPLRQEIEQQVVKLGLKDKVTFYGLTKDVTNFLCGIDAFIFPSLWEGLGIAGIESQCSGLPTYCSSFIPKEANVSDLFIKMNTDRPKDWAIKIIQDRVNYQTGRIDRINDIIRAGYDIRTSAEMLQDYYIESINNMRT